MNDLKRARTITEVSVMAALIVALGLIPPTYLFGSAVPITAQTLGVMLAGAVLGARRGAAATAVVVVLVALSLPVLSGGRGGVGVILGPTGGYLLGWVPGAFVTGLLAERVLWATTRPLVRTVLLIAAAVVGGIGVVYALGIPWTMTVTGLDLSTTAWGALVFVPGDLVKAVLAGLIAQVVHKQIRLEHLRLRPTRPGTEPVAHPAVQAVDGAGS